MVSNMRRRLLLLLLLVPWVGLPQAGYKIYTNHPRIWLHADRVRRLKKDAERNSDRWVRLQRLIAQKTAFPEEPLVWALQFQVVADEDAGRLAVGWATALAAGPGFAQPADLRLGALVYDWCYPLLDDSQKAALAGALGKAAEKVTGQTDPDLAAVRSALLAAVSVAGEWDHAPTVAQQIFERHWEPRILLDLRRGGFLDRPADLVALLEMMHVSRHNLERDLWQQAPEVFAPLPVVLMLGDYPEPVQTPEGLFRRPARPTTAPQADPVVAGVDQRIAQMMLVDYENSSASYQFLQGWLRHDLFTLGTPLGAPYEFIWLNPYLPGLSYFSAPVLVHDTVRGRLFARRGWQEEDLWLGYLDGQLQIVADGQLNVIKPSDQQPPMVFPGAAVVLARVPMRFKVDVSEGNAIYVVGLVEGETYAVKVNRADFQNFEAGRGGILVLENRPDKSSLKIDFDEPVQVQIRSAAKGASSAGSP
jgi:hypothetical protein